MQINNQFAVIVDNLIFTLRLNQVINEGLRERRRGEQLPPLDLSSKTSYSNTLKNFTSQADDHWEGS